MSFRLRRLAIILWPVIFLILGTSWLWAPQLNHALSPRVTLISQYEAPGQPHSWMFRIGDILAASLLIISALYLRRHKLVNKVQWILLLLIGGGMFIDPTFASSCRWDTASCRENVSFVFAVHAIETVITASAIFIIAVYDSWFRKRLVSIAFVVFQTLYGLLLLSQLASHGRFNTISQYIYQLICLLWLAWYVYEYLEKHIHRSIKPSQAIFIRNLIAIWAFLNGLAAIIISLTHIHLLGNARGLYFAGDSAWLAQHGILIGVIMIYISRHLWRGERRARQIFMFICALEVIKYSLITPHSLLILYIASFCGLFILKDQFYRGTVVMTWNSRLKEATFMAASLSFAVAVVLVLLNSNNQRAIVTARALDNYTDYVFGAHIIPKSHLTSALLAHTITAFIIFGTGMILWILFRPYRRVPKQVNYDQQKLQYLLGKYSASPDDYFKIWPKNKDFFWDSRGRGFITFKEVGSTSFALADPIAADYLMPQLIEEFLSDCRSRRLKACILPIPETSLNFYSRVGLNTLQIGSSAVINCAVFSQTTANDKWWRWQKNRAVKAGYQYAVSFPPHNKDFILQLKQVSDSWLAKGGHIERSFGLGYFDKKYLSECQIHYLTDESGKIIAFTNRIPTFNAGSTTSVDLLRYLPEANNAMQYLLLKTIEDIYSQDKYKYFDLGFVPFASSNEPVINLARLISTGRFSSRGLEQFKNKFDPQWQPIYMAYDGDLADLALIAINLEKVMEV